MPAGRGPVSAAVLLPSTLVSTSPAASAAPAVGRPLFVRSAETPVSAPRMVRSLFPSPTVNTTLFSAPVVCTHTPSASTSLRFVFVSDPATVYAKRSVMPPWCTLSRSSTLRLLPGVASSGPRSRRSRTVLPSATVTGSLNSTSTRMVSPRTKVSRLPSLSAS